MATARTRKKRTIIEESLPDTDLSTEGEPTDFDVSLESVEDTEALQEVLSQFGETNVLMKVLRSTSTGSEFCYATDILDEEFIQKNFGGGDYQIRLFINGKYKKTLKIKIASRVTAGNPTIAPVQSGNADFLEKLVLALVAGRNTGSDTATPTLAEMTSTLAGLDALRGKQESGMELFLKGVSFAKETIHSPHSGDWKLEAVGMLKDALPTIANMIPGNRPPVPSPQTPQIPTEEQQAVLIKQGLTYLKKKCISGMEPDLIVDWISNNAEEYQQLIHMVLNIPFEEFVKHDPEIGTEPFKQWFTTLFDGLRFTFIPTDTVDVDTAGSPGDPDNSGNNGKPRPVAKSKG